MSRRSAIRPIHIELARIPKELRLGAATKCAHAAGRALARRKHRVAVARRNAFLDLCQARAWHQKYLDASASGDTLLKPIDVGFYEDRHRHLAMKQTILKRAPKA